MHCLKARLCLDGACQKPGEFADVCAATAQASSFKNLCAVGAEIGCEMYCGDFKQAYLHADQPVPQWIRCPDGVQARYTDEGTRMCLRIGKALYGCKGSAGLWYECCDLWTTNWGAIRDTVDPCLYKISAKTRRDVIASYDGRTDLTDAQRERLCLNLDAAQRLELDKLADADAWFSFLLYVDDTAYMVPLSNDHVNRRLYRFFVNDISTCFRYDDRGPLSEFCGFNVTQHNAHDIELDMIFFA